MARARATTLLAALRADSAAASASAECLFYLSHAVCPFRTAEE